MVRPLELAGRRFGRLVAISRAPNGKSGQARWHAKCDCGGEAISFASHLASGKTTSCGCAVRDAVIRRSTKHGQGSRKHQSRAYTAWKEMKRRVKRDPHYVGKVGICPEWFGSYEAFFRDMGPCPDKWELDRVDNTRGYEPGNCRWVSETTQSRNRNYCKLDEVKAEKIRNSTLPEATLMDKYKVSKSAIQKVKSGRSWAT